MAKLTAMQQRIYDYIAACIREQGYPPSVREIGEAVGLRSPSTVHFHLKHLEEAGMIAKGAGKGRAITLTEPSVPENQVPIVGNVAAGSPILAQECIEDYLTFDTRGKQDEYFALQGLNGSLVLDHGHHDLAVAGVLLLVDNDQIVGQNAGVKHGLAAHTKGKMLSGQAVGVKGQVVFNALLCQNGRAGGYIAHHGDLILFGQVFVIDGNGAGLSGSLSDQAG